MGFKALKINPSNSSGSVESALELYRNGFFPMRTFSNEDEPFVWYTHDPRGVLFLDQLYVSRSLGKSLKKFEVTADKAFSDVIAGCASGWDGERKYGEASWLSGPIMELFLNFHREGHAHSVECWQNGKLAGGLYGLHIGGVFCGESMFSRVSDASKVALVFLVGHLQKQGFHFIDTQMVTDHMANMGAVEMDHHKEYIPLLSRAVDLNIEWGEFDLTLPQPDYVPSSPFTKEFLLP